MIRWKSDPLPVSGETYDGVWVCEVILRFPADAQAGGELCVKRALGGAKVVGASLHLALEPGEPDSLPEAFHDWLRGCLARRGLLPEVAERDTAPLAPPPPSLPATGTGDVLAGLGR